MLFASSLLLLAGCGGDAVETSSPASDRQRDDASQQVASSDEPLTATKSDSDEANPASTNDASKTSERLTMLELERLLGEAGQDFQSLRLRAAEEKLLTIIDQTRSRIANNRTAQTIFLNAHQGLVQIYNRQGRRWEVEPYLFVLLQAGQINAEQLLLLGSRIEILSDPTFTNTALNQRPEDPLPLLNVIRERTTEKEFAKALKYANQVLAVYPKQPEALARKGLLLLELNDYEGFAAWSESLPESALRHPDVWNARGLYLRALNQRAAAERCFWEAAKRDPNSHLAHYQLGLLLQDAGRVEEAQPILARAERLNELQYVLHPMFEFGVQERYARKAAELCDQLGRPWEAWGWYSLMVALNIVPDESRAEQQRLQAQLRQERLPRVLASHRVTDELNPSDTPLPDWTALAQTTSRRGRDQGPLLHFEDVAASTGIDFQYFSSPDPSTQGVKMFETTGGGVAAFDYDLDGWPDLHFTQGAKWPAKPEQRDYLDRLFRNVSGKQWVDVTEQAGIIEPWFSQGVTVGDFDNDGFPDLYVANTHANTLYQNNGDGTFSKISMLPFGDAQLWTTSCMFADLNGDGWLDLYNANYLGGDDIFDRICGAAVKHSCAPNMFDGEQDQVFLNQGDGTWRDASAEMGLAELNGKGLGLIAARFGGETRLSVFVANDAVANHFLVSQPDDEGHLKLVDEAFANGSAFDRDGRFQACMGIAFDDWNNDGQFDFYVTNYFNDSNTLYSEQPGMLFDDATRAAGLRDPSLPLLGFGTQFIDAENDGRADLFVSNGHVDDYTHEGEAYRMPPQLYRNQGGYFVEAQGNLSGAFFQGVYRGRGVATLDWNRDGLDDLAVSHLDSPAALVENKTSDPGHFVALQFVATRGSRDAFGTIVKVRTSQGERIRQLAAGSGYQAANQQQLLFGLGTAERVESVEIEWPNGEQQVLEDLPVDSHWKIVQGQSPQQLTFE